MNERVKLKVQGLTNSQIRSGAYALILAEVNGNRRMPIIVGTAEAQSIAIKLENIVPPRPLTHDLFASFAQAFNIILQEVYIYKFVDGVYYSELEFSDGERTITIDSRTSDAIAIALRVGCDIYTTNEVLEECGVILEEKVRTDEETGCISEIDELNDLIMLEPEDIEDEEILQKWLTLLSRKDLQERLEESITKENYEYAKMYKDELTRRDKKGGNK